MNIVIIIKGVFIMKKITIIFLALLFIFSLSFSACKKSEEPKEPATTVAPATTPANPDEAE